MLFNQENFGKPISEQLSKYLSDWTTENDVADVWRETGVSTSTINYVKRGLNSLTENNSKAILALMKIAVKNCTNKIEYAKRVKKDLEPYTI